MNTKQTTIIAVAGVILVGASFAAGMQFQRSLKPVNGAATAASSQNQFVMGRNGSGFGGGGFRRFRPVIGQVQSLSGSIMVIKTQSGQAVTVSLANNPTVTDNGSASSISNIQTGTNVAVIGQTNSDDSITASRILLNPSFGGYNSGSTTQTQ